MDDSGYYFIQATDSANNHYAVSNNIGDGSSLRVKAILQLNKCEKYRKKAKVLD